MNPGNQLVSHSTAKTLPAHLANGHLGLQGSDSGLAPARSFMVGISDLTPNDVYRMALLPTWNAVEVTVGGDQLAAAFARGDHRNYQQTLDIGTAMLTTEYAVKLGGAWLNVRVDTWLSRADRFLAYQHLQLVSDQDVELALVVGITPQPAPPRHPFRSLVWPHADYPRTHGQGFADPRMAHAWHPGHMELDGITASAADGVWAVAARAAGHGPAVGVAQAIRVEGARVVDTSDDRHAAGRLEWRLPAGVPRRLEQFFAFSRDDRPAALRGLAGARARTARERGGPALWAEHAAAWAEFWRGDVLIEGDETLARQARADLFQLYQNAPVDDRYPIQIMGVASPGYFGGCFWDTDVYNLPALLPYRNELGRGTVLFRKRVLAQAMKQAAREGHRGARYAVVSELVEGEENCVGHSALAKNEIHFTADVALGVWSYYCATGDDIFLRVDGWPVLEAVADYFASRATWIPWEGRYELLHVHSAQEELGLVHNCLYTNAAVKKALRCAARAAEIIGFSPPPLWWSVAERLHIPVNRQTGLYQANSGHENPERTRFLETNAIFLADLPASAAQLADAISVPPIPWDMSYQAAIAAQAGQPRKMREYLEFQVANFVHEQEFLQRTEFKTNDAGPYLSGSSALLQNLLLGAGGLRWGEDGLQSHFPACLPEGIIRITFPRLEWHERAYAVEIVPATAGAATRISRL